MSSFSNIKAERKNILDLLILVTAITSLVNFFTSGVSLLINGEIIKNKQFLYIQLSAWLWFGLIALLIGLIAWRIIESSLFSFKVNKKLPLIYIYDKKSKQLLGMKGYDSPYYHAWCASKELLKIDENYKNILPSVEDKGIGSDKFRNVLRDIFEYSLLATISSPFFGTWKIENEQKSFGSTYYMPAKGGSEVKYDDLPAPLRDENIILKKFKEKFKDTREISGLTWMALSLPPKTRLTYQNKTLIYKNKFIEFNIKLESGGAMVGAPVKLLDDLSGQQDRFITLMFEPWISVKTNPYLALLPQSELYTDWAAQFIQRIEKRIIADEQIYAEKIRKDNSELFDI